MFTLALLKRTPARFGIDVTNEAEEKQQKER